MQITDSMKKYAYGTSKTLASEKEETKCKNIIKHYKSD